MGKANWKNQHSATKTLMMLRSEFGEHFDYSMATDDAGVHLIITCHEQNAGGLRSRVPGKYEGFRVLVMHGNEVRRDNLRKEKEQYEEELKKIEEALGA
tara:strand:+ start:3126 stop:3422 length:297 start_codon:yes stop_codon:yes gene_type:complete